MLLILAAALLGASFGVNCRSRILAPFAAVAVIGAAYVILDLFSDLVTAHAANRAHAVAVLRSLGVATDGMVRAAVAGATSAAITGLLITFATPKASSAGLYLPGDAPRPAKRRWAWFRREPVPVRNTEALERIEHVLKS